MKPSEFTPACGVLLKKMLNATFDKDLVDVVLGGPELGIEFSKVKWNHLLYTGSPAVGKLVMAAAAQNLTPVTLELGGKCESDLLCCETGLIRNAQALRSSHLGPSTLRRSSRSSARRCSRTARSVVPPQRLRETNSQGRCASRSTTSALSARSWTRLSSSPRRT